MLQSDLKSRVMDSIRQSPSPNRGEVASRSAALVASAVALPVVLLLCLGLRPDDRPAVLVARTVGGGLLAALVASWIAMARGGRALGRARVWLVTSVLVAPSTFVLWKLVSTADYAGMVAPWSDRLGTRCFAYTVLFAFWPLVAMAIARRRSDPTHPGSLGAAIGAAAGLYAGVLVDLWCPAGDLWHVLLGHALPIAFVALGGMWIGRLVIAFPDEPVPSDFVDSHPRPR